VVPVLHFLFRLFVLLQKWVAIGVGLCSRWDFRVLLQVVASEATTRLLVAAFVCVGVFSLLLFCPS